MTEEEIKSLSNYLADNLEVEAEGDEVALIYCFIKEWEQDGISRAPIPAPVERIEGLAEAIDRIFPMQLVSGDAIRRTNPHSKTMLNSTEKWAVTNNVSCSGQKLSQLLLDIEHACRAYLKLQGGE